MKSDKPPMMLSSPRRESLSGDSSRRGSDSGARTSKRPSVTIRDPHAETIAMLDAGDPEEILAKRTSLQAFKEMKLEQDYMAFRKRGGYGAVTTVATSLSIGFFGVIIVNDYMSRRLGVGIAQLFLGVIEVVAAILNVVLCVKNVLQLTPVGVSIVNEVLGCVVISAFAALGFLAEAHFDACLDRETSEAAPTICVHLYAYTIFAYIIAITVIRNRPAWNIPPFAISVIGYLVGRYFAQPGAAGLFWLRWSWNAVVASVLFFAGMFVDANDRRTYAAHIKAEVYTLRANRIKRALDETLRALLPVEILLDFANGQSVMDVNETATISVCEIHDYIRWSNDLMPQVVVDIISSMALSFDDQVNALGLHKMKVLGDRYICGTRPKTSGSDGKNNSDDGSFNINSTDSVNRQQRRVISKRSRGIAADVVRFAFVQQRMANRLSYQFSTPIIVQVAVHTGHCFGAVVGTRAITYEVFGEAIQTTAALVSLVPQSEIAISTATQKQPGVRSIAQVKFNEPAITMNYNEVEVEAHLIVPTIMQRLAPSPQLSGTAAAAAGFFPSPTDSGQKRGLAPPQQTPPQHNVPPALSNHTLASAHSLNRRSSGQQDLMQVVSADVNDLMGDSEEIPAAASDSNDRHGRLDVEIASAADANNREENSLGSTLVIQPMAIESDEPIVALDDIEEFVIEEQTGEQINVRQLRRLVLKELVEGARPQGEIIQFDHLFDAVARSSAASPRMGRSDADSGAVGSGAQFMSSASNRDALFSTSGANSSIGDRPNIRDDSHATTAAVISVTKQEQNEHLKADEAAMELSGRAAVVRHEVEIDPAVVMAERIKSCMAKNAANKSCFRRSMAFCDPETEEVFLMWAAQQRSYLVVSAVFAVFVALTLLLLPLQRVVLPDNAHGDDKSKSMSGPPPRTGGGSGGSATAPIPPSPGPAETEEPHVHFDVQPGGCVLVAFSLIVAVVRSVVVYRMQMITSVFEAAVSYLVQAWCFFLGMMLLGSALPNHDLSYAILLVALYAAFADPRLNFLVAFGLAIVGSYIPFIAVTYYLHDYMFPSAWITSLAALLIVLHGSIHREMDIRLTFAHATIGEVELRTAIDDLALQRTLLQMLFPVHFVDDAVALCQAPTGVSPAIPVHTIPFASVLMLRLGQLSKQNLSADPARALKVVERIYIDIDRALYRCKKLHLVGGYGDVLTIVGPLADKDDDESTQHNASISQHSPRNGGKSSTTRRHTAREMLTSLTGPISHTAPAASHHGHSGKTDTSDSDTHNKQLESERSLHRSVEEVLFLIHELRTNFGTQLTAVAALDTVMCTILGQTTPTFTVAGVATRRCRALLGASSDGFVGAHESFVRTMREWNEKVADACIMAPETWAVRGAGRLQMFPLSLVHDRVPSAARSGNDTIGASGGDPNTSITSILSDPPGFSKKEPLMTFGNHNALFMSSTSSRTSNN